MASRPFVNQVRIALIVAQSLLKKSIAENEIPDKEAKELQQYLALILTQIKPYVVPPEETS